MNWPQWFVICMTLFSLGVYAANHGKPRDNYDFPLQFVATVLHLWILWMGGFFS